MTFVRPEQTKFRYRLADLDDDWVDAGNRREVTYYRIPPGEYRFEVMAANSDGVWSTSPATVRIVVHAPFWRRAWFVAVLSLAIVGVAGFAVRRRLLSLQREHTRQHAFARQLIETQEQERRRISNELHDALGQDLFMIKTRARASRQETTGSSAGDALESIEAMATESYAGLKRIAHGLRPYQLDKIGLSKTIDNMVRRVGETCDVAFDVAVGYVDDCFPPAAAINVFRIVQEAVNNVIRHAGARHARVRVDRAGAVVEIVVTDEGSGFDVSSAAAEAGFGLMGIRERAQALGGTLDLQSNPGGGTVLRVTLPVEERHHG
jgi:signal transduction histidine kinase